MDALNVNKRAVRVLRVPSLEVYCKGGPTWSLFPPMRCYGRRLVVISSICSFARDVSADGVTRESVFLGAAPRKQ